MGDAIAREKKLKKLPRAEKIALIDHLRKLSAGRDLTPEIEAWQS